MRNKEQETHRQRDKVGEHNVKQKHLQTDKKANGHLERQQAVATD